MEENKEEYYSLQDIINTSKAFISYLRRKWWILALAIIAGAGLGASYYYIQKPKYEAVTTFILEDKSPGSSGLAGLASQFGFNMGSLGGGGNIFTGDNILNILKSKKIVQQVLLSYADSNRTLADFYLEFTGIKKGWQKKPEYANFNFAGIKSQLNPIQDSILNDIYHAIEKKNLQAERLGKQSTIIRVKATAADCLFARLLAERLVDAASKLYLEVKTSTAQANIEELQRRSDSLLILLNRKSYTAATSQPLDFNPGVKSAIVPVEIATRDKTVLATLYAEVTKSLEMSKLILAEQTPVIQVLDRPSILLGDNRKGLTFLVIVCSFFSFAFFFAMLSAFYFLKGIKKL